MKQYESYKDSGIQWIGNIPEEWTMSQIKYATYVKGRIGWKGLKSDEFLDEGYAFLVTGTDFEKGKINWENCYSIDKERYDEDPFIQIKKDDLLITKDGTIGKVAHIDSLPKYTCLNSGIFVVRPLLKELRSRYLYYVLISNVFSDFFDFNSTGATILHLYQNVFDRFGFPIPAIHEQNTIISFLDHKTTQIDALIEKKEQLVEKLKLQRQAIINEAVTKGLNPNAPMKDSGIEWLGEIPEHWEVVNFRYVIDILTDYTANGSFGDLAKNVTYLEEGYSRLIRLTDLREDLTNKGVYISEESHNYLSKSELFGGEVLLANVGAYSGLAWLMPHNVGKASLAPNMFLLKFKEQLNNEFAYNAMISDYLSSQFKIKAVSAAQPKINKEDVRTCLFLLPPQEEQLSINSFIKEREMSYTLVLGKLEQSVEKLKLYRQSLISEAVTGKIDVRDWEKTENK